MTDIQKHILNLLSEVDTICRKYDIEYYLEAGAVLGAIRHGGFLPWDDDSDLTMTRTNWEKFKEAFVLEHCKDRALESPELNDKYPTNTARYIDTTTTNIWRSLMYDECACGIAVDIFILEDAPDDDDLLEQMKCDFIDYCEIINPYYRLSSLGDGKRYNYYLEKSKQVGLKAVFDELNQKINQYHGQSCKRYLMRWGMRFQVYDKTLFGKPVYVPFEDIMLPIPEKPYEYLAVHYGMDWVMIPQTNEVESHDTVRDLNIGYKVYMDDYMPLIDKQKALEENFQCKVAEMKVLDYNKAYHKHIYGVAGEATVILLQRKLDKLQIDLATAFKEVTYESERLFDELFTDYLNKQLHRWYMLYNVFVPVSDEVIACIIRYLFISGRGNMANKLIAIREKQKKAYSAELQCVIDSHKLWVKSNCLFWEGKHKEAAEMIRARGSLDICPEQIAICQYYEVQTAAIDRQPELCKNIEQCMKKYPKEELFRLVYICSLLQMSNYERAHEIARYLQEHSHHGMVLRRLKTDEVFASLRCSNT